MKSITETLYIISWKASRAFNEFWNDLKESFKDKRTFTRTLSDLCLFLLGLLIGFVSMWFVIN